MPPSSLEATTLLLASNKYNIVSIESQKGKSGTIQTNGATLYRSITKFSPSNNGNDHSCTSFPTLKLSLLVISHSVAVVSLKTCVSVIGVGIEVSAVIVI